MTEKDFVEYLQAYHNGDVLELKKELHTEKRFENRLNKDIKKFNVLNPVWDNEKEDALNVFEMIDLLNELHEENKTFREALQELKEIGDYQAMTIKEFDDENQKLKKENGQLRHDATILIQANQDYRKENEQLKQSFNEVLKDLEATTFDKELLEKENEQLKHELLCKQLDKAPTESINCKCHYEVKE